MIGRLGEYFRSGKAVSALEYAAIVSIIVVGMGAALVTFRGEIQNYLTNVQGRISSMPT